MGVLREERFSGSGRGGKNEGLRGVETIGGDGNKTGLVMKVKKIDDWYWCQPHRGLQGKGG